MKLVVTKTEPVKRNMLRVWINDEPAFRIPSKECSDLNIREGETVTAEALACIHTQVLLPMARKRCLDILTAADRSRRAVYDKLLQEEFPEDVAELAVQYAESFHYIDDRRYAESFIEHHKDRKSAREITFRLREKGVPDEVITAAFEEAGPVDVYSQIRRWAEKKRFDPENAEPKEKDKFFRFLAGKGYSLNDIKKILT